jgi:hypothetical protein
MDNYVGHLIAQSTVLWPSELFGYLYLQSVWKMVIDITIAITIDLYGTLTYWPAKSGTASVKMPLSSMGQGGISSGLKTPFSRQMR